MNVNLPLTQFNPSTLAVILYIVVGGNIATLAYTIRKDNTGSGIGLGMRLFMIFFWPYVLYKGVFKKK